MNKYLLLATVADRVELMPTVLSSCRRFLPDWRVVVVPQGYTAGNRAAVQALYPEAMQIGLPERVGPHNAKAAGLRAIVAYQGRHESHAPEDFVVCSIDDDMEFTARTKLDPAAAKCRERGVGFVSAGWVKAAGQVAGQPAPEEFVRQPVVYTGGGLVFGPEVTGLIGGMPDGDYFCDNSEWSLRAYLAGYENFRYRGSVTVHRICGKGGRRAWVKGSPKAVPDPVHLPMRPGKGGGVNNYHVGQSSDLTALAKETHARNRAALLGAE